MKLFSLLLLLVINIGCVVPEARVRVITPVHSCTPCHSSHFTGPYIHNPRWARPHYRTLPPTGFKVYR